MPIRTRILLLSRLPDAGYLLVMLVTALLIIQAVIPAATAIATSSVVGMLRPTDRGWDAVRAAGVPLAALGLALLLSHIVEAAFRPASFLAAARIDGTHRERLATLALSATTVTALEQPAIQDLIKATNGKSTTWVEKTPSDGALGQLFTLSRYVGLTASGAVVAQYSWWLVVLLVVPALTVRMIHLRTWLRHFRIWAKGLGDHRYAKYWAEVATTPEEGKELRVFGFSEWLIARREFHVHSHMEPVWADDHRAAREKWVTAVLTIAPLTLAFALIALGTAAGHSTIAVETAVLTASWSVYMTVSSTFEAVGAMGAVPVIEAYERLRPSLEERESPAVSSEGPTPSGAPSTPLVRFEGVSFTYPDTSTPVLDHCDLEIKPGELLAIVGLNGAGKSTVTKLLAGLYTPTAGQITVDGVPIDDPAHGGVLG